MAPDTSPSTGTAAAAVQFQVDEAYEFRAPKYFDFVNDETEDEVRAAERWFEASVSHAPSPFAPRIKESRMEVKIENFGFLGSLEIRGSRCVRDVRVRVDIGISRSPIRSKQKESTTILQQDS